jgi:hypothetical protein
VALNQLLSLTIASIYYYLLEKPVNHTKLSLSFFYQFHVVFSIKIYHVPVGLYFILPKNKFWEKVISYFL